MRKSKSFLLLSAVLVICLALCGCAKTIKFTNGKFSSDDTAVSVVLETGETALLSGFDALASADFSGSLCYGEILKWAEENPQVDLSYTVAFADGQQIANDASDIDLSAISAEDADASILLLQYLPELKRIRLSDAFSAEQFTALSAAFPEAEIDCSFPLMGSRVHISEKKLDLSKLSHPEVEALLPWLSNMENLELIELGSESNPDSLSWDDILRIRQAAPEAVLDYDFELYGLSFNLSDSSMDLNHIEISDEGALVKTISACMANLSYLDMDSCGVSDEAMAEIRDNLPNTEVVWRIWFGSTYSVRTNVTRILASNPGLGGELTEENTRSLKYCTDVIYLDLGHNSYLNDLSFVSYMPDLEVLIVAMANWSDISPLADCPKLEYAEIQTSALNDLSPLAGLKNLRHLNICHCFALHDLSPIYELELDRLWIGYFTPIPPEQVEEYKKLHPDCKVNTTTSDPTDEGWRYLSWDAFGVSILDPRYELLRDQMKYGTIPDPYAYYWNDPLY